MGTTQDSFEDFPQWRADICELLRLAQTSRSSTSVYRDAETAYFETCYPDPAIRRHKRERVVAALRWLEANSSEIARRAPKSILLGDGEAQIGGGVVLALFAMFSRCPVDHLNDTFPVDVLIGYLG